MSLCLSTEVQASTGTTSPASKNNRHSKVGWIRSRVRQSDVKVVNNTHTTTHSLEGTRCIAIKWVVCTHGGRRAICTAKMARSPGYVCDICTLYANVWKTLRCTLYGNVRLKCWPVWIFNFSTILVLYLNYYTNFWSICICASNNA